MTWPCSAGCRTRPGWDRRGRGTQQRWGRGCAPPRAGAGAPLATLAPPHQTDWLHTMRALVDAGGTVVSVLHEVSLALQADDIVVMAEGRVLHQGACDAPATHAALESVFDHRIHVRHLDGMWMALPSMQRKHSQI